MPTNAIEPAMNSTTYARTHLILLTLSILALLATYPRAHAQPVEAHPEVRVLTYTNVSSHWRVGSQDWQYPDGGVRHGGGEISGSTTIRFHRYHGGYHRNSSRYHTFEGGAGGGGWDYFNSSTVATSWLGPCPADASQSSWWSNYTTWPGNETPGVDSGTFSETLTNYTWEPYESRTVRSGESVMNWTLIFDSGPPHQGYFEKWSHTNHTDTGLEVFGGGWPGSSNDVTMQLNVWAYDNLRQRYLTWNEMTVHVEITDLSTVIVPIVGGVPVIPTLDLTPDTNGNVFFLMQDNAKRAFNLSFHPTNGLPTDVPPGSVVDVSFWANPTRHQYLYAGVDRNGDSVIEITGTNDLTTSTQPYLFWVNNDWETFSQSTFITGTLYYEFDDKKTTTNGITDFLLDYIHNERDLEDFSRLHLQAQLPFADAADWGVRIKGGDLKLFGGSDGTLDYLKSPTKGSALVGTNGAVLLGRTGSGPVWIPGACFDSDQKLHLLFEAGQPADVTMEVELVWRGEVVGVSRVWLKLLDVKSMYDQWVVGDVEDATPSTDYIPAFTATHAGSIHSNVLAQLTGGTNYILFVHGWNMLRWEKQAFAETAFKRLWWQGYRGRYGAFRWPTYHMGLANVYSTLVNYDCSEYNSWKSATALENLVVHLNATNLCRGNVRVMAHSMGNVVTGEALRRLGTFRLTGTDLPYVRNYLALQAAIPTHTYDSSEFHKIDFYPLAADNLTPNRYANYWRDADGVYFSATNGAGAYKNITNTNDYALKKWIIDQHTKPDESLGYWYSAAAAATSPQNSGIRRGFLLWTRELFWPAGTVDMADTHEIFAFGIEPRSGALGAATQVQGHFGGNQLLLMNEPFYFGSTHDFHSKQFRSTIALQWEFWKQVRVDFELNQ